MDDLFENINALVSCKQIIEYYHMPLNRANKVACPFHNEKTPSLSVNEKENMWKCFGCGVGGDGISFVARLKNIQQIDAAKMIANDFHLNIDFDEKKPTPKQIEIKDYILQCQQNIEKTDYLQKRGLTLETLKFFGVGYDTAKRAVVIPYSRSYTYYQRRSVDTKAFYKVPREEAGAEPLWNENALRKQDKRPIFVVESPICAMSIMQYSGVAVALCGVDNADKFLELCKKIKPKSPILLCLDNDEVGRKYSERMYEELRELGIKCHQFNVADTYKDPNELLMHNPAKLCERIYQGNLQAKRLSMAEDDLISAKDLFKTELEPIHWVVQNTISEGLTILVASSKIGKSWMMMQLAHAIVEKQTFLDRKTTPSGVLYFALEDSDRRLKERMNKVWKNKEPPDTMFFKTEAKTLDTGLVDQLKRIIKAHKEIKVIIFDTFQKIRGSAMKNESAYAYDYREMAMLKSFAERYDVSIILVHHTRKMLDQDDVFNMTSGSTAIMGASDTSLLIYKKKRGDEFATLYLTGRDVLQQEKVINRSEKDGTWSVVGSPEEQEAKHKQEEFMKNPIAQTLLALLKKQPSGWSGTVRQLVNACYDIFGTPIPETESAVGKMLQDYDFQNRIYQETHCEHSSKRRKNGVEHTFAPPQRTFWNDKD